MAAILKKWRPLLDFWWLTCFFDQIVPKDVSYQISCLHHKLKDFKGNLLGYLESCLVITGHFEHQVVKMLEAS